jgi:hypothetical protein
MAVPDGLMSRLPRIEAAGGVHDVEEFLDYV